MEKVNGDKIRLGYQKRHEDQAGEDGHRAAGQENPGHVAVVSVGLFSGHQFGYGEIDAGGTEGIRKEIDRRDELKKSHALRSHNIGYVDAVQKSKEPGDESSGHKDQGSSEK